MQYSWLEVQRFLETTTLSRYARLQLPYGMQVPGDDHSEKIKVVFPENLEGKSVLDVGCHYGLYLHEAKKRGAGRVVGVEKDLARYTNARKIAGLINDGVEIIHGDALDLPVEDKFDIVLFLSVLHHVNDPLTVMKGLAQLSRDTVVVEFPLHTHQLRPQSAAGDQLGLLAKRLENAYTHLLLKLIGERIGLIVTGDRIGNTFVYNKNAFRTVFQEQHKLFREISFVPGPFKRHRMFAFCKVTREPAP